MATAVPTLDAEDVEDLEEAPDHEVEAAEAEILDQATAARTIDELKAEIATLGRLEALAGAVRRSGEDRMARAERLAQSFLRPRPSPIRWRKTPPVWGWPHPTPTPSPRQKLVIFTEHRYPELSRHPREHTARAQGSGGRHPRRHGPRGALEGPGVVPARSRSAGVARHRRSGRGHQPATGPPDGQL